MAHFSSYHHALMVIFFLQVEYSFPVLKPDFFQGTDGVELIEIDSWQPSLPALPMLLMQYFSFYVDRFNWMLEVVSVRLGRRASRFEAPVDSRGIEPTFGRMLD
eukprot:1641585-Amphidinium_carterae.1